MKDNCATCKYDLAYQVTFQSLNDDLKQLQDRVERLESALTRGLLLLVANLAGVALTLAQQLMQQ